MKNIYFVALFLTLVSLSGCNLINRNAEPDSPTVAEAESAKSADGVFSGNYMDLLSLGDSAKCTWSSTEDNVTITGTTYVANQKMRSETSMPSPETNEAMLAYAVVDNDYIYSWTSESNMGTKMKLSEVEDITDQVDSEDSEIPTDEDFENGLPTDVDFKCEPWKADSSMLTPPSEIEFTDLTEMLQNLNLNSGSSVPAIDTTDVCAICQQIPEGSGRAECLESCQ